MSLASASASESTSTSASGESSSSSSSSSTDNRKTKKSTAKPTKGKGKQSKSSPKKSDKKKSSKKDSKSKSSKKDSKKRKTKKKKDPNAPKRASTAYLYFSAQRRKELAVEGVKASMTEQSTQLSNEWKTKTEKEKAPFLALAEKDKKRYEDEMKKYTPPDDSESGSSSEDEKKTKKKKKKDPNEPKRPLSSYMVYVGEQRPLVKDKHPDLKQTELITKIGEMWKGLSAEKKKPYEKKAAELKEKYQKDHAAYLANK